MLNNVVKNLERVILLLIFVVFYSWSYGQSVTKVRGKVFDAKTKEPLGFVDVGFKGTTVGTSTDLNGYYTIDTRFPSDTLFASFLGYKKEFRRIVRNTTNNIDFYLEPEGFVSEAVVFKEKKAKYSKKNNPAVDLYKKVILNRYKNWLKSKEYYSYEQHEKIRLDLNNITEEFKNSALLKKLSFLWDYIDVSDFNGKTFLPVFMRETLSDVYYKKEGNVLKEIRKAYKYTELDETLDPLTVNDILDVLYQEVDVYAEKIDLLGHQFISPFSGAGYNFYRYYILDTTEVNGRSAINLAFIPAVKGDFGFTGNIFVTNDTNYTVLRVDLGIINGINLNFVRDIKISQEFDYFDGAYIKTKDQTIVDYALTQNSIGAYGSRTLYFRNFNFEKPNDLSVFSGHENIVYTPESHRRDDDYWEKNRLSPLNKNDRGVYQMIDRLVKDKYYKRYLYIGKFIATGYLPLGGYSFGPVPTFVNFNRVEGLNLRFGGETNVFFNKKFKFQGYASRSFKIDIWKYSTGLTYSFNDDWSKNPRHFLQLSAERETTFPGQETVFFNPQNILLSFQRGNPTKMLLHDNYQLKYVREFRGLSYHAAVRHITRAPLGTLEFFRFDEENNKVKIDPIVSSEITVGFRFAPNERFIQGKEKRRQIINEYPILTAELTQGFKGVFGSQYNYTKTRINLFKQFQWLTWGNTNLVLDMARTWGDVPYILQEIPVGNQTYAYELRSFNLMNFMEFSADKYLALNFDHYWYGFFFNRIPLIKNLKLREVMSFKAVYGELSDRHNPLTNPQLMQFSPDAFGNQATYLFRKNMPYMEGSIGITNILKLLRIDLVKRFNYLDHNNVPQLFGVKGLGILARIHAEF